MNRTVPTVNLPTVNDVAEQVTALEARALGFVADAQAPVTGYVGKVAGAVAERLPADRPALLTQGLHALVGQVDFVKTVLDTQVRFAKSVLDAAVEPVRPASIAEAETVKAPRAKTSKTSKASRAA